MTDDEQAVSRERLLIATLTQLADTLVDDYDAVEFLSTLCERTADVIDADAVGVLLVRAGDELDVVAASSRRMRTLEVFEVTHAEGPCMDAYRTGEPVITTDLRTESRWPRFREEALTLGYRSAYGQPLRLRDEVIGALNVYNMTPGALTDDHRAVVRALANIATIGIVHERTMEEADEQIARLRRSVSERATVEQAKGIIAERLGITPEDGFDRLRRHARSNNLRLRAAAQQILHGELDPHAL